VSAEAPPGFAQHIYRCSFAAPYSIERVVLQALHKESAQEGIFVQGHKKFSVCTGVAQKIASAQKLQSLHKNCERLQSDAPERIASDDRR
jgi:hypothetical protein